MTLVKWQPTSSITTDFDRMIDSIFNDGWNNQETNQTDTIAVDIVENDKKFILSADFPGFSKKDVNLKVEENLLTLSTNQENEKQEDEGTYRIRERRSDFLKRSFTLPENVLAEQINAKFKDGTLTVNIPKSEEVKPNIHQVKIS